MTGYDAHGNFLAPQELVDEIERLRAALEVIQRTASGPEDKTLALNTIEAIAKRVLSGTR